MDWRYLERLNAMPYAQLVSTLASTGWQQYRQYYPGGPIEWVHTGYNLAIQVPFRAG